jgi:hypothetical protein
MKVPSGVVIKELPSRKSPADKLPEGTLKNNSPGKAGRAGDELKFSYLRPCGKNCGKQGAKKEEFGAHLEFHKVFT